jgi:uncharacterized protein YndB with AHSA1/START domain
MTFVRKELVARCSQHRAFEAFTRDFGQWWPLGSHHIGAADAETAIIEPFVNGRWFERAMDGSECDWGRVLAWEPPRRLVLSWNITTSWQFDPNFQTEVEVTFQVVGADRTRIVLEHRHLDRYGAEAEKMRSTFDSEGGWGGILQQYVSNVEGRSQQMADCPARPAANRGTS